MKHRIETPEEIQPKDSRGKLIDIDRLLDAIDKNRPIVFPYECEIACTACIHRLECVKYARTNSKEQAKTLPVQVPEVRTDVSERRTTTGR